MPKTAHSEKYEKKYSEGDIQKALKAIDNGMSQRKAAAQFNVPRATLQFRVGEKFRQKTSHGPDPVLTADEENSLKKWILTSQRKGFPLRIDDIQYSVKNFLDKVPRKNPFSDNTPGRGWYKAFLRRHPDISLRTPEGITAASSNISESDIRQWFVQIELYLKEKGYYEILEDPTRVYNGDETCFFLSPKSKKVLAAKGSKNVYQIEHHPKVNLTVMFTFSASGDTTPPMIIYPYKRLPSSVLNSVPDKWGVGTSDTGWMKNENFFEYIGNVFYKHLKEKQIKFPIILFVDGHATHLTYQTSHLCAELGIILVALYPNATRIMQPADVAAFKPLKAAWGKATLEFRRLNPDAIVNKETFAVVVKKAIETMKPEATRNGFRRSGLFPWNPSAIDYSKCIGKPVAEPRNEENLRTMSYATFKQIVGMEKVRVLETLRDEEEDENLLLLSKVHKAFLNNKNQNVSQNDEILLDEQELKDGDLENEFSGIQAAEDNDNNEGELDIQSLPIIFNVEDEMLITNFENSPVLEDTAGNDKEDLAGNCLSDLDIQTNSTRNTNGNRENERLCTHPIIYQPVVQSCSLSTTPSHTEDKQADVNPVYSETAPQPPYFNASLQDFFFWPKTPERKGKKNSEKLPFVLTSSTRKNIEKKKAEKKKEELKLKEDRKEKRLQKQNIVKDLKEKQSKAKAVKRKPSGQLAKQQAKIKQGKQEAVNRSQIVETQVKNVCTEALHILGEQTEMNEEKQTEKVQAKEDQVKETQKAEQANDEVMDMQVEPVQVEDASANSATEEKPKTSSPVALSDITNNDTCEFVPITLKSGVKVHFPSSKTKPDNANSRVESVKRRVFCDDDSVNDNKKIKFLSNILLTKGDKESHFMNMKVYKGVCHHCTWNISVSKSGIRCQCCLRLFHVSCALKISAERDAVSTNVFFCDKCRDVK